MPCTASGKTLSMLPPSDVSPGDLAVRTTRPLHDLIQAPSDGKLTLPRSERRANEPKPPAPPEQSPTSTGSLPKSESLLEETIRIGIIVEAIDLFPSGLEIELFCFGQGAVGIQAERFDGQLPCDPLGFGHEPLR